jgi:4-hydroxybenzoate polyprenyltransferase
VLSYLLLGSIGMLAGAGLLVWVIGLVALAPALVLAASFIRRPDVTGQKRIDLAAGLWVFACYAIAGLAGPLW